MKLFLQRLCESCLICKTFEVFLDRISENELGLMGLIIQQMYHDIMKNYSNLDNTD